MTAPTSDERREVAAMLRERERGWRKMGIQINVNPDRPATNFENIAALLGFSGWILYADVFARLADFIDPTCKVVPFDEESMRLPHCSICMQPILKPWPNFCPNCGARVVSGDD